MLTLEKPLILDAQYVLTQEQKDKFRKDGFIKLKNVFPADVLEYYGNEISGQVFRLNTLIKPMNERTTYEKAFLQVMNIWTKSEIVKEFCFGKRLARCAAELMGTDGVRMYHDQALYKEPNGGLTPWHADQSYWPLSNPNTVTVWIPLQATPMDMGPLAFSVGSHNYAVGRGMEISDESEQRISKELLEKKLPMDESPFDLGEVSFHYGWTFHRAGPNVSKSPRKVMTIIYMDKDIRVAQPQSKAQTNDWNGWLPGTEIGEVAASPINPVLWEK